MKDRFDFALGIIQALLSFAGVVIGAWLTYKIAKMHKQFNSRMDEYLKTNKELGNKEGRAEEKAEQKKKGL